MNHESINDDKKRRSRERNVMTSFTFFITRRPTFYVLIIARFADTVWSYYRQSRLLI